MKVLALLALAVSLGGCVAYPYVQADPYYGGPGYQGGGVPYAVRPAPVIIQGGAVYRHGPGPGHHGHGYHGRRDHDGDGVPNRYDARPHNPRRY